MREFFTDKIVAELGLEPSERDQWAFDRQQTGLALRLRAGADGVSKTWYHTYRFAGQKRRDPLGRLCDVSLNDARMTVNRRQRDVVENSIDPRDAKIAALYERKLVLVRPDGHVAWRGDDVPGNAAALIDQVRGAG